MQEEISLLDLWNIFKRHSLMIIIMAIIGAIISGAFMIGFVDSEYSSEAQLIVNQSSESSNQNIQYSDLQTSINLINTYRDIILSPAVLDSVIQNTDLDFNFGELKELINVEQSQNSQSFNVSIRMQDPKIAQTVLTNIIQEFKNRLKEIYKEDVSSIFVLSEASYNQNRVSPSLSKYLLIGGLLGLIISLFVVVVKELSDTTVKDSEFMVSLGLISLGEVGALTKKERHDARLGNQVVGRQKSRRKV